MDIRNRMADVRKLRCNACQDFLKLVVVSDWQKQLYDIARKRKGNKSGFAYSSIIEQMRKAGIENYSIESMDVTSISTVISYCQTIAPTNKKTQEALQRLNDGRKTTSHSNENEDAEVLYLQALLDLYQIKSFVKTVDEIETSIDDETRLKYMREYIAKVDSLMEIIDNERIVLVQRNRDIQHDIQKIRNSSDPTQTWLTINKLRMDRDWILEKNHEKYFEFAIQASNAGIIEAHYPAAMYYNIIGNYAEAERRINMIFQEVKDYAAPEIHNVLSLINDQIKKGVPISDELERKIKDNCPNGYSISLSEMGLYKLSKI